MQSKMVHFGDYHPKFPKNNQKKLELQSHSINSTYSWDVRSLEWKNFFEEARKLKN